MLRGTFYLDSDKNLYFLDDFGDFYFIDHVENIIFKRRGTELSEFSGIYDLYDIMGNYIGSFQEEELGGIWGKIKGAFKKMGKGIVKGIKALRPEIEVPEEAPPPPFPLIPVLIGGGLLVGGLIFYFLKKE